MAEIAAIPKNRELRAKFGGLAKGASEPDIGRIMSTIPEIQLSDRQFALIARALAEMGYQLIATRGTARFLRQAGINVEEVPKLQEGRPNLIDYMKNKQIALVINTTFGKKEIADSFSIRREALMHSVPYYTTVQAARMAVGAIEALARGRIPVISLQDALQR